MYFEELNENAKKHAIENINKAGNYGVHVSESLRKLSEKLLSNAFDGLNVSFDRPTKFEGTDLFDVSETVFNLCENKMNELIDSGAIKSIIIDLNGSTNRERVIANTNDSYEVKKVLSDINKWLVKGINYYNKEFLTVFEYVHSDNHKANYLRDFMFIFDEDGNVI